MVKVLDSTLREGEQTPGVCFDSHIKGRVAELLDGIGIDIVELGHPAVSNDIYASVKQIAGHPTTLLKGAHSRSLKTDIDLALDCGIDFLGIFYCVSDLRLKDTKKTIGEVVGKICDMIRYAKSVNDRLIVRYTPEDTVRSPWENVVYAASEAVRAGADIISIADTTGFMIPGTERNMARYVSGLKSALAAKDLHPQIAVHCHNDRGLALANALDGIRGGATVVDASVLGLGERAGIVDLAMLLSVLASDFQMEKRWNLELIPELYDLVSRHAGVPIPVNLPVTGKYAFTHCAGVHTQAAIRNPVHYESLDPERFGRETRISLDHMSGIAAVKYTLEQLGHPVSDPELLKELLGKVKAVGHRGRIVDPEELDMIYKFMTRSRLAAFGDEIVMEKEI